MHETFKNKDLYFKYIDKIYISINGVSSGNKI